MYFKSLNRNRVFRQILPSLFFIILFALGAIQSGLGVVSIVVGIVILLFLGVLFFNMITVGRVLGVVFLLVSCYMMLAIFDDFADGEATWGYLFGVFLFLSSAAISVLLILGYKKPLTETGQR